MMLDSKLLHDHVGYSSIAQNAHSNGDLPAKGKIATVDKNTTIVNNC